MSNNKYQQMQNLQIDPGLQQALQQHQQTQTELANYYAQSAQATQDTLLIPYGTSLSIMESVIQSHRERIEARLLEEAAIKREIATFEPLTQQILTVIEKQLYSYTTKATIGREINALVKTAGFNQKLEAVIFEDTQDSDSEDKRD